MNTSSSGSSSSGVFKLREELEKEEAKGGIS
jgi:hypothetical protein